MILSGEIKLSKLWLISRNLISFIQLLNERHKAGQPCALDAG
jgi:hypothetical protein